jgi:hypothetical protein
MRNLLPCLLLLLPLTAFLPAHAEDEVKPAAATDAAAPAPKAKADDETFTPPPGWRAKQRGKFTIYCRKQSEKGTRLPKEVCYDEEGIRAMLQSQREDQERVDQMRRVCSSQAACGSN